MNIPLAYGKGTLDLTLDPARFAVQVISPKEAPALADPKRAFAVAVANPIGSLPLREIGRRKAGAKAVIVIADHTRPVPDRLLVPWVAEALGLPDRDITILVGTGTHRASTEHELRAMLGEEVRRRFRVVNHDCRDRANLVSGGRLASGTELLINRLYAEADIRICTGFIEPHFVAGFSGGPKAVVPGLAGLETVLDFHSARLIGDPRSSWGELETNPLQRMTRELVSLMPPDAIVNVTLNSHKEITGVVCGHFIAAHRLGCERALAEATVSVSGAFPLVVTTNSGYPLDQNFYQTVKGISAAARITAPGGVILCASECSAGLPPEGEFTSILSRPVASEQLLADILAAPKTIPDQWQVQILLQCLQKNRILLHSALSDHDHAATRTERCADLVTTLERLHRELGGGCLRVAVLPLGPLTIPRLG